MKQPMVKDYKLKDRLLGLEDVINYMLQNYDNQFEFVYALVGSMHHQFCRIFIASQTQTTQSICPH